MLQIHEILFPSLLVRGGFKNLSDEKYDGFS